MFNYIIIIMAGFQRDMNNYEKLIKNDLLNLNGKNNRVETEIAKGNRQYKANVMLWIACARPYIPVENCEILIDTFGADPNYVAPYGSFSSCLMVASGLPNLEKVELLLSRGADVNYHSHITGYTALIVAVMARQMLNCRMLIFAGANPNPVFRQADPENNIEQLTLLDYANTLDDPNGIKIREALTTLPAQASTTMALFIGQSMREGFINHDFENIEDFYEFLQVPEEDPNVAAEAGGSSKKRKRTKRRKTNKKRRTNRRK
jgi:ankyrin repeat protein